MVDHMFLRCALDVLLAAAELKDDDEVRWTVARRLFSKEPFLDFGHSDPAARSFLLRAAFDLLEIGNRRSIPVCAPHDPACRQHGQIQKNPSPGFKDRLHHQACMTETALQHDWQLRTCQRGVILLPQLWQAAAVMLMQPGRFSGAFGCDAQVNDIIQAILQLLQCLTAEHIALHEWRKDAETHFRDGDALDIGEQPDPLCPGLWCNICTSLMHCVWAVPYT